MRFPSFLGSISTDVCNQWTTYYALRLIGAGTGQVESLVSYVRRLAHEHWVTPLSLLRDIAASSGALAPGLIGYQLKDPVWTLHTAEIGRTIAKSVAAMTANEDLSGSTFHRILPLVGGRIALRRRSTTWCPLCYVSDPEPYDRLLWLLPESTCCPKHKVRLTGVCPRCGGRQPNRLSHIKIGHCGTCDFDFRDSASNSPGTPDEVSSTEWFESTLALIQQPGFRLKASSFGSAIRRIRDLNGAVGAASLARILNVSRFTAYAWMRGGSIPSLRTVHSLCCSLNVSLETLLKGSVAGRGRAKVEAQKKHLVFLRREPSDYQALRIELRAEIEKPSPVTARQLAKRNGVDPGTLRRSDPESYRKLILHHKNAKRENAEETFQQLMRDITDACDTLRDSGLPITKRRIAAFLPKKGGVLQSNLVRGEIQLLLRQRQVGS